MTVIRILPFPNRFFNHTENRACTQKDETRTRTTAESPRSEVLSDDGDATPGSEGTDGSRDGREWPEFLGDHGGGTEAGVEAAEATYIT